MSANEQDNGLMAECVWQEMNYENHSYVDGDSLLGEEEEQEQEAEQRFDCPVCGEASYGATAEQAQLVHGQEADHMGQVEPGLFVGAFWHATRFHELRYRSIGQIVCMARELGTSEFPTMNYFRFDLLDETYEWIVPQLIRVVHLLDTRLLLSSTSNTTTHLPNTLVHCKLGKSRSAAAVAAFLLYRYDCQIVCSRR